jgi:putative CRISPR-associated protein (TIGR02619 family)
MNGLLSYYKQESQVKLSPIDAHFLITTDTYQGKKTALLLEGYLRSMGVNVVGVIVPPGFSTKDYKSFASGINYIIKWCEESLPGYRQSRYHIVFNLVGGFKSLQGYMNILGMFYADEIIYIFEAPNTELIRIPRLPIVMDEVPVLKEKATLFALMEQGYLAKHNEILNIPEIYLEFDENRYYTLSTWGHLVWERNKEKVLGERLLEFPHLTYRNTFIDDFYKIDENARRANIQTKLAMVSLLFGERGLEALRRDSRLLYENYTNRDKIGHFRIDWAWRVSCYQEGNELILRHVGPHDYVNNNP